MLYEPTTLASVARVVGETLQQEYGIDPAPVFARIGIDRAKFNRPGARVAYPKMRALWATAADASGDVDFGLRAGARAEPSDFYVLGHAWIASATLLGAMERLCRFTRIITTVPKSLVLDTSAHDVVLRRSFPDPSILENRVGLEAGFAAFLKMCALIRRGPVHPSRAELALPRESARRSIEDLFRCRVSCGHAEDALVFARHVVTEPLPGWIPDVLDATARIARRYLESLEQDRVTTEVRSLLTRMLPAGKADQAAVAARLHRSPSTLQRQLAAEGTSYREVLESTRRALAEHFLREGDYTQAEIAFMLGFSDQSNFARAFKRWTGMTPGGFRRVA